MILVLEEAFRPHDPHFAASLLLAQALASSGDVALAACSEEPGREERFGPIRVVHLRCRRGIFSRIPKPEVKVPRYNTVILRGTRTKLHAELAPRAAVAPLRGLRGKPYGRTVAAAGAIVAVSSGEMALYGRGLVFHAPEPVPRVSGGGPGRGVVVVGPVQAAEELAGRLGAEALPHPSEYRSAADLAARYASLATRVASAAFVVDTTRYGFWARLASRFGVPSAAPVTLHTRELGNNPCVSLVHRLRDLEALVGSALDAGATCPRGLGRSNGDVAGVYISAVGRLNSLKTFYRP